jgi:hypothetical protein
MRRTRLLLLFALICLLAAAHAAPAKDTWTSVRSKNFYLVGNASEKEIRQVATRLEQFRTAAADAHAKTDGALAALEFVPATFKLKQ